MKLITWNVNGARAREAQILELVAREAPDVLCLQEIKAAPEQLPESLTGLAGYGGIWHGQKGYSGVALLVKGEASVSFQHPAFDHESRAVSAVVSGIEVASLYVPNGGKDFPAKIAFLTALAGHAREAATAGRPLVLLGDLNVAHTERDVHPKERKAVMGQLPEERNLFSALLAEGLVDVGRALDPDNDALYTWWAPWRQMRERNIGWRLDYALASTDLAAKAKRCEVLKAFGTSDHAPVVVDLEL